jgi:hypothetical protein
MRRDDVRWLKKFLAVETRVPEDQISARQAVLGYKRRRLKIVAGLALTVVIYWIAAMYWPTGKRTFLVVLCLVAIVLCWLAGQSRRSVGPAGQLVLQEKLAAMMSTTTDQIPDAYVKQYDHWNWRYLTFGLALAAAITLVIDWIKPNIALEFVDLLVFYLAGAFACIRLTAGDRSLTDSSI